MYYEKIFKKFQAKKVDYLIAGGMAVNLYGIPRFTKDLDILIDSKPKNLIRLEAALKSLGYRPKIPVSLKEFLNPDNWARWGKEKGMTACALYHPKSHIEQIDLLINTPISYDIAKRHYKTIKVGDLRLTLVSIEDLIRMKRHAGRQQDIADIDALQRLKKQRRR